VPDVRVYEQELYRYLESRYPGLLDAIAAKKQLDDEIKASLDKALTEFSRQFADSRATAA